MDPHAYAGGGYDTKVTSASMLKPSLSVSNNGAGGSANAAVTAMSMLRANIVNGPTSQGQKPFVWSTSGLRQEHMGQPDVFDFVFEAVSVVV